METVIDNRLLLDLSELALSAKRLRVPIKYRMPLIVIRGYGCVAVFDSNNALVAAMKESVWDELLTVTGDQ